ncbi:hypothetical protein DPMN_104163 [Dreissena polymorpha]|uniref:Uncharacterized protein n=1 Tax=Dreissena polymorpha TaxID=45954 RepID=A0A9D4H9V5_DREPO|nr:hypothetical protein DPMN_104163 [Dreissena polymorpha]
MRAAVDPAPVKEQRSRWRRRNAAETAAVPEPASAPVSGPQPEAVPAAAPPAKRKRTDDNAENDEVVDFCDICRTADVVTTWPEAAPAAAPPAKRKRTDDNAENDEVVDFCDICRTADVVTTWAGNDIIIHHSGKWQRFRGLGPFANTAATPMPAYLWNQRG